MNPLSNIVYVPFKIQALHMLFTICQVLYCLTLMEELEIETAAHQLKEMPNRYTKFQYQVPT